MIYIYIYIYVQANAFAQEPPSLFATPFASASPFKQTDEDSWRGTTSSTVKRLL